MPDDWWASRPLTAFSKTLTLLAGGLLDVDHATDSYRAWDSAASRASPITFVCGAGAAGAREQFIATNAQLLALEYESALEYDPASGAWRALYCPALSLRGGFPNPQCRKLGASVAHARAAWPKGRELTYLGLGRVMAWERSKMRYDVFSFAARGLADPRRNTSSAPFFEHVGSGRLAGIDNRSTLVHLRLPVAVGAAAAGSGSAWSTAMARHVVLEVLPDNSYRVWNSEGWAAHALRGFGDDRRSPLAGPVGRGRLPSGWSGLKAGEGGGGEGGGEGSWIEWTSSASEPAIVEVDRREGSYRTLKVHVGDMDTLEPGTTTEPPLYFQAVADGLLDESGAVHCGGAATTREACAAAGGACGWCEQIDGVQPSVCLAGGPFAPCGATRCASWHFDEMAPLAHSRPSPPPSPPSPPGLGSSDLQRLESHRQTLPPVEVDEHERDEQRDRVVARDGSSVQDQLKKRAWWRSSGGVLRELALRPFDAPEPGS